MVGDNETSMINGSTTATAVLTRNAIVNGVLVLESMLRITADMASMVTCSGTNNGTESINFFVSGTYFYINIIMLPVYIVRSQY
jgi:hypothetical protein